MTQHSYSGIKTYENCARKYHETKILKLWPREDTTATLYGTQLHEQAELYIRDGKALDKGFEFLKPMLDNLIAMPGRKFCELEMGVKETLEPCDFNAPDYWCHGIADLVIVDDDNFTARVFDYKGLALDTKVPTPKGWTTMGAIVVGDTLFAESGEPCTVLGKSKVKRLKCYEVVFDDGTRIVCDEEHLWQLKGGQVVLTKELRGKKKAGVRPNGVAHIATARPLAIQDAKLPIDPYVLGVWLADGKHTSGEISKPDTFIWEEIQRRGYTVNMQTGGTNRRCPQRTVQGLVPQLRAAGLLGNKHIPQQYLRAGHQQRLDLLRGLMDGDGYANPTRKQAVLSTVVEAFADSVCELLCTLGQRPLKNRARGFGFGKTVDVFPVSFRPNGINPFLLPRKRDVVLSTWGAGQSLYRSVTKVSVIDSVPTQCIVVDSPDHTFLCSERMIPTHNSGSDKYPDTDQLMLMSLMIFKHFPHVRTVTGGLLFVLKNTVQKYKVEREQEAALWWRWRERIAKLDASIYHNVWNPKQSGLCRKHCEVLTCSFNGRS
jgi:hypothetical protein